MGCTEPTAVTLWIGSGYGCVFRIVLGENPLFSVDAPVGNLCTSLFPWGQPVLGRNQLN